MPDDVISDVAMGGGCRCDDLTGSAAVMVNTCDMCDGSRDIWLVVDVIFTRLLLVMNYISHRVPQGFCWLCHNAAWIRPHHTFFTAAL